MSKEKYLINVIKKVGYLFEGEPEDLINNKESYTAKFLKKELN